MYTVRETIHDKAMYIYIDTLKSNQHVCLLNLQQLAQSAHYLVLVDSHFDASGSPYRYLPQEDVELVTDVQVCIPM